MNQIDFNKIVNNFFTSGYRIKDPQVRQRFILINAFSLLGIGINLVFGTLNFVSGFPIIALIEISIFFMYLGNIIFLRRTKDINSAIKIALGLTLILVLIIYILKGYSETGYYWSVVYPLVVLFLVEKNKWRFWIYSYFISAFVLLYLQVTQGLELALDIKGMAIWNIVLLAVTGIGLFFKSLILTSNERIATKNEDLTKLVDDIKLQKLLLNTVLDTIGSPIYTKNKQGQYTLVNKAFAEEVYGIKKELIEEKTDLEIENHISEEKKKEFYLEDLELMIIPNSEEERARYKFNDGRYHDVIVNKTTINNEEGEVEGMVGVLTDVSKLIEVQNEIETERKKFQTILESIGDGVIVLDKNKEVILVNSVTEDLSGYEREELIGEKYDEKLKFKSSRDGKSIEKLIEKVYEDAKTYTMERNTILVQKNGAELPVGDSAAPILDEDGNVTGCIIVFRDITKDVEIDKSKSEFISVVSHQLKTPITSIKWLAQLLEAKNDEFTKEQKETVNDIVQSADKMSTMINELLDVSRIETGKKFAVVTKKENIIDVIQEEVTRVKVLSEPKKIKLKFTPNFPQEDMLKIDREKIAQVFHNLLTNAVKYSPPGAEVTVGFKPKTKSHIYYVEDQGLGIPKEEQLKIFDKFYRAKNVLDGTKETTGTGLGLFIAKNIVEGHGGKIWFESEEGKGSVFYVSLPK